MKQNFCDIHIQRFFALYEKQKGPLDLTLGNYFKANKALGSKDRKTIGDTVFGMTRFKSVLDWSCPKDFSFFEKLEFFRSEAFKHLITSNALPDAIKAALPEWLFNRLEKAYGKEKALEIGHILNTQAPITVRINPSKTTREEFIEKMKEKGNVKPCKVASFGVQFENRVPLFSFPEFKEGLFEVQDEGSQLISELITAKPGDQIIDYCSGSGGKTLGFAHLTQGKGQIYLHDIRASVLIEAKKRLRRAGVQNAQYLESGHPKWKSLIGKCDWVLIDVPCSGCGTFRRNPDQKWKLTEEMVENLILEQRKIAKEVIPFLKTGGKLVYATCSILPEENEHQVDYFLKEHPLSLEKTLSLLPEMGGMDGFFGAIFTKS